MLPGPPGHVDRAFENLDPSLTQGFLLSSHGPGRATNNGTGMAHLLSLWGVAACDICGNGFGHSLLDKLGSLLFLFPSHFTYNDHPIPSLLFFKEAEDVVEIGQDQMISTHAHNRALPHPALRQDACKFIGQGPAPRDNPNAARCKTQGR